MASLNLDRPLARAALEAVTDEWSNVTNVHRRMRTWKRNSVSQVLAELYRGGKIERRSVNHRSWGAIWEYRKPQAQP